MKICVVGNSAGFKMRPPRSGPDDRTYSEILEDRGHRVRNVSKAGVILGEQFSLLDDEVVTFFPDVVILHHGIVEVFFRRTVRRWNNAAITNYYRNGILRRDYQPDTIWFRVRNLFWRGANAITRTLARILGLRWQWQQPARFLEIVLRTCETVLKETAAMIMVVGITPPSQQAEQDLPGLTDEVRKLNDSLRDYCRRASPRLAFLDTEALLNAGHQAKFVPDGIHFSAGGHRLVAAEMLRILEARTAG